MMRRAKPPPIIPQAKAKAREAAVSADSISTELAPHQPARSALTLPSRSDTGPAGGALPVSNSTEAPQQAKQVRFAALGKAATSTTNETSSRPQVMDNNWHWMVDPTSAPAPTKKAKVAHPGNQICANKISTLQAHLNNPNRTLTPATRQRALVRLAQLKAAAPATTDPSTTAKGARCKPR